MESSHAEIEFLRFAAAQGSSIPFRTPEAAVNTMLAFFREARADDCEGGDRDMLLFQWGTGDWGVGRHFEVDITRQFISGHTEGDDDIWQLHATFSFEPSPELEALATGDRWCGSLGDLGRFEAFVRSNAAYRAVAERTDGSFRLRFESVE
ncbi:MAG: hypothetical protein ACHREM_16125 [Polyangiales bacterium]